MAPIGTIGSQCSQSCQCFGSISQIQIHLHIIIIRFLYRCFAPIIMKKTNLQYMELISSSNTNTEHAVELSTYSN